jgi:group I intron endonuclease
MVNLYYAPTLFDIYQKYHCQNMVIYKTTNLLNGKIYVGKAESMKLHYIGSGCILKRAIKKYGKNNFKKEIIESCNSREELEEREKFWIKELDATNPEVGYNIAEGGSGGNTFYGKTEDEMDDIREKISKAGKGRTFSEEHRKKLAEAARKRKGNKPCKFKGMKYEDYMGVESAETIKEKIKASRAAQVITEEAKRKISEANKGKTMSEESKRKISEARKAYWKNKQLGLQSDEPW